MILCDVSLVAAQWEHAGTRHGVGWIGQVKSLAATYQGPLG
jgi:hypothetical protein